MRHPFEIFDITNKEYLYGRDALIKKLIILAKRCENASIIGARRFGKTCLLKSISAFLKENDDIPVYPLYLDFKTEDLKGTDAAYRYMISSLLVSLYNEGLFTNEENFGAVNIKPSEDWTDIDEQLMSLSSVRLQSCLKRVVLFFAELLDKTILFIIDEYEYLFKYILDTPASFMKLRDLSTTINEDGLRPFIFWISGAVNWDHLCTDLGSGECNPISATEYVTPIDKPDFIKMWNDECELIDDNEKKELLKNNCEFAWEKSGGVPFYGKLIGGYILRNHTKPNYSICSPCFKEMIKTLSIPEVNILKDVSKNELSITQSIAVGDLIEKGIITKDKKKYIMTIMFLKEYLIDDFADTNLTTPKKKEHETLVAEIGQIIENINKTQSNKRRKTIFKPTIDSVSTYKDLTGPCYSSDLFAEFSCAIYRIYFEWTKESKPKELLPNRSFKNNDFSQYVDIARHSLGKAHQMDTFELAEGKKTKTDMLLSLLGSANEPKDPEEFYKLQLGFLKLFKATLIDIQTYVRKN